MTDIRPHLIKIIFLLQIILSATAGFCIETRADTGTTARWEDYGFSPFITSSAKSIEKILLTTLTLTVPPSAEEFFAILRSNWGRYSHLQTDSPGKVRISLDDYFDQLGMHQARRELAGIPEDGSPVLLIYLGAHPSILCKTLPELDSISGYVSKALIVGSSQEYDHQNFASCHNLNEIHRHLFNTRLPGRGQQRAIMYAYLCGVDITSLDTVELDENEKYEINNERLRSHFNILPEYLSEYGTIIIVAPQPYAVEAELIVARNMNPGTNISRIYTSSEMNIDDHLNALRSLLKTDHCFQNKKCCTN